MKKILLVALFACLSFFSAQAQNFQTFLDKFQKLETTGILIKNVPIKSENVILSPEDKYLDVDGGIYPIGKIMVDEKTVIVLYLTYALREKTHRVEIWATAFQTNGSKINETLICSYGKSTADEAFEMPNEYVLMRVPNKNGFYVIDYKSQKSLVEYNAKKKEFSTKLMKD